MAGRFAFVTGVIVASVLSNLAIAIAIVALVTGITSTVVVVRRVRELTAQTAPLAASIEKLTGRVTQMEATLQGDE